MAGILDPTNEIGNTTDEYEVRLVPDVKRSSKYILVSKAIDEHKRQVNGRLYASLCFSVELLL